MFLIFFFVYSTALSDEATRITELDKFWSHVSGTVKTGDFEAYRAAHHPDGVLLNDGRSSSMESAHKGFQSGFEHTAAGAVKAGIEFRWSHRSGSTDTAWEKGAFRYWSKAGGTDYVQYTSFETVLVKGKAGWQLLFQNQEKALTKEQWDALK